MNVPSIIIAHSNIGGQLSSLVLHKNHSQWHIVYIATYVIHIPYRNLYQRMMHAELLPLDSLARNKASAEQYKVELS